MWQSIRRPAAGGWMRRSPCFGRCFGVTGRQCGPLYPLQGCSVLRCGGRRRAHPDRRPLGRGASARSPRMVMPGSACGCPRSASPRPAPISPSWPLTTAHGRAVGPHGMHVWCGFDADPSVARSRLGTAMEHLYQTPFEKFARYSPAGTPEKWRASSGVRRSWVPLVQPHRRGGRRRHAASKAPVACGTAGRPTA